jgi:succinate dehydrogenase / fumarate reductase flavoprotein subunit
MLDLVVKDGRAAASCAATSITGAISSHCGHAVVLATGGYGNVFYLSTNAKDSQRHGRVARAQARRAIREPVLHADPPDVHPASDDFQSKLTLMSESLRNDGRIWVPKRDRRPAVPDQIPEDERDYFLERRYPRSATSCRATSRRARSSARSTPAAASAR